MRVDDYGTPLYFLASDGTALTSSPIANPYLFTGRRHDPETAWYHYRTRYLDPAAGRFTTRDIIGIWGDPINLGNGYTYVGNNTFGNGRVDPSGMAMQYVPPPPPPPVDFGPTPEQEWEECDQALERYCKLLADWRKRRTTSYTTMIGPNCKLLADWRKRQDFYLELLPVAPRPDLGLLQRLEVSPGSPRPSPPILPTEERSSLDPFGKQTIMGITLLPGQSMSWGGPGGTVIIVNWWPRTGFTWVVIQPPVFQNVLVPQNLGPFLPFMNMMPQWPGGPKGNAQLCVDGASRLVTPDGPRRLADIRIGDEVLTPCGEFRRVVDKDFGSVWDERRNDYVRISTPCGSIVLTRDHIIGGKPAGQWRDGDAMTLRNGEVISVTVRPATSEVSGDLRLEGDAEYVTSGGFVVGSMMSRFGTSLHRRE